MHDLVVPRVAVDVIAVLVIEMTRRVVRHGMVVTMAVPAAPRRPVRVIVVIVCVVMQTGAMVNRPAVSVMTMVVAMAIVGSATGVVPVIIFPASLCLVEAAKRKDATQRSHAEDQALANIEENAFHRPTSGIIR